MARRLSVQVLASHAEMPGDRRIGPASAVAPCWHTLAGIRAGIGVFRPSVGIPTLGISGLIRFPGATLPQVGQPSGAGSDPQSLLERVGFAHELAECLAALTVVLQDRGLPGGPARQSPDLAGDLGQSEGPRKRADGVRR